MPVKFGVIGCGAIAQRRHIPEAAANSDSSVAAVTDSNRARAEEIAKKYGAKAFTDYKEMLKADIDAVVVCTPNSLHAAMTIDALNSGRHVLCEKPMATTRPDATAMIKAAEKNRKYLAVAMNQRIMAPHLRAKAILKNGQLGKVLAFRTSFKHPGPEGWSVDGSKSWFFQKALAVMGVSGDLGVHKVDLLRWLLDDEFVEVGGYVTTLDKSGPDGKLLDLDDNAVLTLKSAGGVVGSMFLSWTNYGSEENDTILYCQNGVLSLGADPVHNLMIAYRNGDRELHKLGSISTNTNWVKSGVIDSFTRNILKGTPPEVDGAEGYRSLDVILAAMEASRLGKTMQIGQAD